MQEHEAVIDGRAGLGTVNGAARGQVGGTNADGEPSGMELVGLGGARGDGGQRGGRAGGGAPAQRDSWGATTGLPLPRQHTGFAFSSPSFEEFFADEVRRWDLTSAIPHSTASWYET